jgi:ribosomal protein S18 acetylase RimI-like enzyme
MRIKARDATESDLTEIIRLYGSFADEQAALRPLWHEAHGLPEPIDESFAKLIAADAVTVGSIGDLIVGFLVGEDQTLVDGEERVGVIRYLYTAPDARGVGVADEMFKHGVSKLKDEGIKAFDAPVSPGHREAKNFYEAHGFSARSITMHSHDPVVE